MAQSRSHAEPAGRPEQIGMNLPLSQGNRMTTHSITLPDGRSFAYAEYGIPDGRVVLWMHGLPGSRRDWSVGDGPAFLTELGLRLIAPDRPGFGRSSPHTGRTYASFVADLASLTARLAVESGVVLGYSGGTPYALAVGAEQYCGPCGWTGSCSSAPSDRGQPRSSDAVSGRPTKSCSCCPASRLRRVWQ